MATADRSRVTVEQLLTELNNAAAQARESIVERRARGDVISLSDCWFATWEELRGRLRTEVIADHNHAGIEIGTRTRYVTEWTPS